MITRDGQNLEAKFITNPIASNTTPSTESGWYKYVHTLDQENFKEDGEYKISLSSMYNSTDSKNNISSSVPDNSIHTNGDKVVDNMRFVVDTVAPEIRNIMNLDKEIVNAQSLDVNYNIVDVGGISEIQVLVDGQPIQNINEFKEEGYNYTGSFRLNEKNDVQKVQFIARDKAGNIVNTGNAEFSDKGLYTFHKEVLVSTNFFVRWFANKPLFFGSIAGMIGLLTLIFFIIIRRKDEDEEKTKTVKASN